MITPEGYAHELSNNTDVRYNPRAISLCHQKFTLFTLHKHGITCHRHATDSLPPANEVWSKVMCLHLSVILFTEGTPACNVQGAVYQKNTMGWKMCIPVCNGGVVDTPLGRHPLWQMPNWADIPQADTPTWQT